MLAICCLTNTAAALHLQCSQACMEFYRAHSCRAKPEDEIESSVGRCSWCITVHVGGCKDPLLPDVILETLPWLLQSTATDRLVRILNKPMNGTCNSQRGPMPPGGYEYSLLPSTTLKTSLRGPATPLIIESFPNTLHSPDSAALVQAPCHLWRQTVSLKCNCSVEASRVTLHFGMHDDIKEAFSDPVWTFMPLICERCDAWHCMTCGIVKLTGWLSTLNRDHSGLSSANVPCETPAI